MCGLRVPALALAIALVLSQSPARAEVYGDILVVPEATVSDSSSRHGYVEHRVSVTNQSAERSHEVTLALPGNPADYGRIARISRSVVLAPRSSVVVSLLQPPLSMFGSGLEVTVDGRRHEHFWSVGSGYGARRYGAAPADLRISQTLHNRGFQGFAHQAFKPKGGNLPFSYVPSSVTEWSGNWLAYSSYEGVMLEAAEWYALSAAVRLALTRYVECGGVVVVVGRWELPEGGRRAPSPEAGLDTWYAGFGQWIATGEADLAGLTQAQWRQLEAAWQKSNAPWRRERDERMANETFPVVSTAAMPARRVLLVMVSFLAAIGANVYLLARYRRRIWVFWTVPALSLLASIGVSVSALLAEDWTARVRMEGLTLLDEGARRATTIGWQAMYTPITLVDGLHYSYDTELTPQLSTRTRNDHAWRSVDWTRDQHLANGWVTSRIPAHFVVRRSETRRERLSIRADANGALEVVNGLGADIATLWLADRAGKVYRSGRVAPGAQVRLTASEGAPLGQPPELRRLYGLDWLSLFDQIVESPSTLLVPGSYIAALDDTPFMEDGASGKFASRRCRSIVFGFNGRSTP